MTIRDYPHIGEQVQHCRLANGLEIMVVPKPHHAKSYAFFATRYGGMDMKFALDGAWQDTPAGIAHYLEHKMFDTEEGDALQKLAKNGAVDNAFTSNAITAYFFECTEKFYDSLEILLSFVSVPYFTKESVEKEQGIIAQEIRMVEDEPDWRVYANLMTCLYQNSPVRIPVAGTVESIRQITPETLYACHKAFYCPSNMVLVCVGNVDAEKIALLAEQILPQESGGTILRDYGQEESSAPVTTEISVEMEVSMPMFLAGFKCPPLQKGENHLRRCIIGDMACDILFGESSSLYNRLYEDGTISGNLGGSFDLLPGVSYVYVGGDAKNPRIVFEAILDEAQRLVREGIDEEFYQQIRCATYGQMIRSLNSFENIAVSLAEGYFRGFDYYSFPEIFASVTKADIEAFLMENIIPQRAALSLVLPSKQTEKEELYESEK